MQCMQVLRRNDYAIGKDISIMGYDNIEPSQYLDIPLTTMEQHEEEIGRRAAEMLLEGLAADETAPRPAREIVFIPRLVIRDSTGAPPSKKEKPALAKK